MKSQLLVFHIEIMAYFTILFISATLLYLVRKYSGLFSELFILWSVARGGNSRKTIVAKNRLLIFICRSDRLDQKSVVELYSFVGEQVNYNIDIQEFHKVLLSYKHAVLFRDKRDGSLRGVVMIDCGRRTFKGKSYMVMQCGTCYFDMEYRGGSYKHYVLAYFRLRALLTHPFTPFLLVAEYFNYKTYAQLAHTFEKVYPSYGKETPDYMKEFIDDFAMKKMSNEDKYDSQTSVLKRTKFYYLRSHATESWSANLKDPHVRFFCERNPGWDKGYQLIAVASIRLRDILVLLQRITLKVKSANRQQVYRRPKLLRRVTFQSEHANKCAKKMFLHNS